MNFAVLVQRALGEMGFWIEEVRQDVCNVQSDIVALQREAGQTRAELETMRRELGRVRAEFEHMKQKVRFQELVAQEAKLVFSDAGMERRRLAQFERLAAGEGRGAE